MTAGESSHSFSEVESTFSVQRTFSWLLVSCRSPRSTPPSTLTSIAEAQLA